MHKAILMDRDGTLIKEKPGVYLSEPEKVQLYKNTFKALKLFKKMGYKLFIVSNQSGIGRGYFTESDVKAVNKKIAELLKNAAKFDGIYYCPHAPDTSCTCRKPAPKMGFDIIKRHRIDASLSYVIGDKKSDIDFARALGMKGILVLSANGKAQKKKYKDSLQPHKITSDIYGAAKFIEKENS